MKVKNHKLKPVSVGYSCLFIFYSQNILFFWYILFPENSIHKLVDITVRSAAGNDVTCGLLLLLVCIILSK